MGVRCQRRCPFRSAACRHPGSGHLIFFSQQDKRRTFWDCSRDPFRHLETSFPLHMSFIRPLQSDRRPPSTAAVYRNASWCGRVVLISCATRIIGPRENPKRFPFRFAAAGDCRNKHVRIYAPSISLVSYAASCGAGRAYIESPRAMTLRSLPAVQIGLFVY